MPGEAHLERIGTGLAPVTEGWFVVNAADAAWAEHDTFGKHCSFELSGPVARGCEGLQPRSFPQFGIGLSVLQPGEPSTLYHEELGNQEDFLVLSGRCRAVVEGEERSLRRWDFLHCPPGTKHSFVGVGDEPCVLLTVGARTSREIRYHPTPLAESVPHEVAAGAEAYAPYGHWRNEGVPPELPGGESQ